MPQQLLLEATAGKVFHDGLGELEPLRASRAWYPHDLWLWLLAARWARLGEEEAFVGRAAEVGDDLGSRIVTARIVRDLMRLCFLQEKVYAPYSKWLGSAFLDVRPIHHRLARRVRAHFFVCMLAHYIEWHMLERLAPLLFVDEDKAAAEA